MHVDEWTAAVHVGTVKLDEHVRLSKQVAMLLAANRNITHAQRSRGNSYMHAAVK
jgi:hypothetical protein